MTDYKDIVDQLFEEADDGSSTICVNPVTGGRFVRGEDPIGPQKRMAAKALKARAQFELQRPADAPPLPLSYGEREDIKGPGIGYIVALFARSLEARDYAIERHPTFDEYARGVMASPLAPALIKNDPDLLRRYPPTPLPGLGPGLYWDPPRRLIGGRRRSRV